MKTMLETTLPRASSDRKGRLSAFLDAAKIPVDALRERVLGSPSERQASVVNTATYQAALVLGALFLLSVAVWLVVQLAGYEPIRPDNDRTLAFTNKILQEPGTWILEKQLPLLQFATYSSLVKLFGWGVPLVLVPLLASAGLALLVGYIARRVSGGGLWAFVAAALMLASLPIFVIESRCLPFYAPTLLFGYGGAFAAIAYARRGGRMALIGAALALPAAVYSFGIGLFFVPVPALYLLVDRTRPAFIRLAQVYAIILALIAPWLAWHFALDGFRGLWSQQTTWLIDQGYLDIRNREFWGTGSSSRIEFLGMLREMVQRAAGPLSATLAALSILGLIRLPSWSWRAAALLALGIPIGALVLLTPAAYERYVYILLPGLVILSIYGLHGLLRLLSSYRRTTYFSSVGAIVIVGLLGTAFLQNAGNELDAADAQPAPPHGAELALIADLIDDDRAVIGSRYFWLILYERQSDLLATDFTSEEDFVTYLSWPSDEVVAEMFERNDIGWLVLRHPVERWERDYNVWLREAAGHLPRHHLKVKTSGLVEEVYPGYAYSLYRVVPAGEASSWRSASSEPASLTRAKGGVENDG